MYEVTIDTTEIQALVDAFPKRAGRAAEYALDNTARAIKTRVGQDIPIVFDRPTPYTRNSLQVKLTQGHNMIAWVWFKQPERMREHYLVPEVEGGERNAKGFEWKLQAYFHPSKYTKLDQYGNMSRGTIMQIMSVLGLSEGAPGENVGRSSNLTDRSAKRNRKPRDYVVIHEGNRSRLTPGVYQRVRTGPGITGKAAPTGRPGPRRSLASTLPFGEFQKGRAKGKFYSVVRAKGLRPIMIQIDRPSYRKRLYFYETGRRVYNQKFEALFWQEFKRLQ